MKDANLVNITKRLYELGINMYKSNNLEYSFIFVMDSNHSGYYIFNINESTINDIKIINEFIINLYNNNITKYDIQQINIIYNNHITLIGESPYGVEKATNQGV